jgi:hypothetical protein
MGLKGDKAGDSSVRYALDALARSRKLVFADGAFTLS